jgi:hypothetical protein
MKILRKSKEIFNAWGIAMDPSSDQFDLAQKRILICNGCEFKREDPYVHCSICTCSLKIKIYTPNTFLDIDGSCPKEKWKPVEIDWLAMRDVNRYNKLTEDIITSADYDD